MGEMLNFVVLSMVGADYVSILRACSVVDPAQMAAPEELVLSLDSEPLQFAASGLPPREQDGSFRVYFKREEWPKASVFFEKMGGFLLLTISVPNWKRSALIKNVTDDLWAKISALTEVYSMTVGFELLGTDGLDQAVRALIQELLSDHCVDYAIINSSCIAELDLSAYEIIENNRDAVSLTVRRGR